MSHFAKVENGVVTEVIVATQEEINSERHGDTFLWVQCSYNGKFRGGFPGVGHTWDGGVFTSPKPHASWELSLDNTWQAPVEKPELLEFYIWNEGTTSWDSDPEYTK
jgi:hypothetical protein